VDRSIRLLLFGSILILAIDAVRISYDWTIDPVHVEEMTIRVNSDPVERLRMLPGIGPVIAERIVVQRTIRPFVDSSDLVDRIRGLGPAFVATYGPWLDFRDEPVIPARNVPGNADFVDEPVDQEIPR
jgi:hypothetical protein